MAEQLITAGEAAQLLGVTLDDIPANKCITKAEFELLTVVQLTVVSNPSDATVKLNETVATSIKVTKGTSVTITISKYGFYTHTETVIVNATMTKNITLSSVQSGVYIPSDAPVGVYILSTDGFAYKRSAWNTANNSKAVGVGVKTSKCSFVIAPVEQAIVLWSDESKLISDCTTGGISVAKTDYVGKLNTDAIVAQLDSQYLYAALLCRYYSFKNGAVGYLPALGELYEAGQNKSEVDACMSLIGGKPMHDKSNSRKWSSTQQSDSHVWIFDWEINSYMNQPKYLMDNIKIYTRPFTAFQ